MPQSPESASASTAEMTQLTGEVVITKEDDSIEIEVSSSKLATPRLYAFALTDALEGFFAALAAASKFFRALGTALPELLHAALGFLQIPPATQREWEADAEAYNENMAQYMLEVAFWTHRPLWQFLLQFQKYLLLQNLLLLQQEQLSL